MRVKVIFDRSHGVLMHVLARDELPHTHRNMLKDNVVDPGDRQRQTCMVLPYYFSTQGIALAFFSVLSPAALSF